MSNEDIDKFLLKLFERTADKGESSSFNKYETGRELGLVDAREVERIVKILLYDGFGANNEVTDSKFKITEKGQKRVENNQI